jgi:hypothetical protein
MGAMNVLEFEWRPLDDRRRRQDPTGMPRTKMRRGQYYAEIVLDRRAKPAFYHAVVQKKGSTDILSLTQHRTLDQARHAAETALDEVSRKDKKRA